MKIRRKIHETGTRQDSPLAWMGFTDHSLRRRLNSATDVRCRAESPCIRLGFASMKNNAQQVAHHD